MIVPIQILRAVAALAVVFAHLPTSRVVIPGATYGAFGVDLFFVISGFIMVHSSGPLYGSLAGARSFISRRIARIVPVYWLVSVAQVVIMVAAGGGATVDLDRTLCSFAFYPCGAKYNGIPILGPGWTLNFEMFFYVAFALALPAGRRGSVALISTTFIALVALGRWTPLPLPFSFWTNSIILEFVLGALLGLAYAEGLRAPKVVGGILVAVGVGLLLVAINAGSAYGAMADWHTIARSRPMRWGIPALLIVAGLALPSRERAATRVSAPFVALGDASYSIYLLHSLILMLFCNTSLGRWGSTARISSAKCALGYKLCWGWF